MCATSFAFVRGPSRLQAVFRKSRGKRPVEILVGHLTVTRTRVATTKHKRQATATEHSRSLLSRLCLLSWKFDARDSRHAGGSILGQPADDDGSADQPLERTGCGEHHASRSLREGTEERAAYQRDLAAAEDTELPRRPRSKEEHEAEADGHGRHRGDHVHNDPSLRA